jgi:uncharacterized protein (TIGR00725 family)
MGSGLNEHETLARPLGRLIARLGLNLLTGAGRGVMTAVSRAFVESRQGTGISIGIVPCESGSRRAVPRTGYPNPYVELPIYTHLPLSGSEGLDDLSRNHINVLSSDVIVVLPGSAGTLSEVELAARYGRPAIAFASDPRELESYPDSLLRTLDITEVEAFIEREIPAGR